MTSGHSQSSTVAQDGDDQTQMVPSSFEKQIAIFKWER